MSAPITGIGKLCSGHGSFPPRPIVEGSDDFIVESINASRVSDALAPHGSPSPSPPHGGSIADGSQTYFINGLKAGRIGDPVDCGSAVAQGMGTFIVG